MDLIVRQQQAHWGDTVFPCAIGKGGILAHKQEGDGATPIGQFQFRHVMYRPDRVTALKTVLPISSITPADGWCDAPTHPSYNKRVSLPFSASHEVLWKDEHIYDIVVVIGHNDAPIIPGNGSAVFLHLAKEGYQSTQGCVALSQEDMLHVLAEVDCASRLIIKG
ncbi:MAG: L,D-transpeptidase family protein [Alphaproteobacteria bacterium]